MSPLPLLDPAVLLHDVAVRVPRQLRENVVVIGSIASAWAFRDVSGTHAVATKDNWRRMAQRRKPSGGRTKACST